MSLRPTRQSLKLNKIVHNGLVTSLDKYEKTSTTQVEFIEDEHIDIVIVGINKHSGKWF